MTVIDDSCRSSLKRSSPAFAVDYRIQERDGWTDQIEKMLFISLAWRKHAGRIVERAKLI